MLLVGKISARIQLQHKYLVNTQKWKEVEISIWSVVLTVSTDDDKFIFVM